MSNHTDDIENLPKGWTKEAYLKTKIKQQLKETIINNDIRRICNSYLYLHCYELQGIDANQYEIMEELECLQGVFNDETANEIFEMAKNNHKYAREILHTGALYYSYYGDYKKSLEYYNALSDYYKQHGMMEEHQKCQDFIKELEQDIE